jgi:hypothetical protein
MVYKSKELIEAYKIKKDKKKFVNPKIGLIFAVLKKRGSENLRMWRNW